MNKIIKYFKAVLSYRKHDRYDLVVWHTDLTSNKQYKEVLLYLDREEMLSQISYLKHEADSRFDRIDKIKIRRPAF